MKMFPHTLLAGFLLFAAATAVRAQTVASTGTIEGRVLNAENGNYLNNARVYVTGTDFETTTNSRGEFRLSGIPAGPAGVAVAYTGLAAFGSNVIVEPGKPVVLDVAMRVDASTAESANTVVLDAFKVSATRDSSAAAIAINEQRNAGNIKSVMAADAFGDSPDGNIGDSLKFLPGVNLDFVPEARAISIRGMATNFTSVTLDDARMASAASGGTTRTFELEQVSMNNVSRVEVVKSRTPDLPADALGGSVNMVSKTAFEQSKPSFSYKAYMNVNSQARDLEKTPGPQNIATRKVQPGADFSLIYPVSKTLGFTLSGLHSKTYYPQDRTQPYYAPNSIALPGATVANPWLAQWEYQDGPQNVLRESVSGSVDWKFTRNDTLSFKVQYNRFDRPGAQRFMRFNGGTVAPRNAGPTFTESALGRGNVDSGTLAAWRRKYGESAAFNLKYEHRGPVWLIDGLLSTSSSKNQFEDAHSGYFENVLLRMSNVTVNFYDLDKTGWQSPGRIEVLNAAGTAPVDYTNIANYRIVQVRTLEDGPAIDTIDTARLNASRVFSGLGHLKLKAGLQVQRQTRDITRDREGARNFVGPDHVANTADDMAGLYDIADTAYMSIGSPFGGVVPRPVYADHAKLYQLYVAHPDWFVLQNAINPITMSANESKYLEETVSSAYVMGDARFFNGRLRVVGGARLEHTNTYGEGVLNDPNNTYQKDANGNYVLNGSGQRIRISTDPVVIAQAQYTKRGTKTEQSYQGLYPSLDAAYSLRPNLILRGAYARSIGRPELSFIIPGSTISDASAAQPRVTVVNTALRPMQTNSYDLSLEYYFEPIGLASVSVYLKDMTDASGAALVPATLELLESYGIPDPEQYVGWDFAYRQNTGDARISGIEVDFRRSLKFSFLPDWTSKFSVFANGSKSNLDDNGLGEFSGYISEQGSVGLIFESRRFSGNVKLNYRGRQRLGAQTFAPNAYDWYMPRQYVDINANVRLTKQLSLFVNGRNVFNEAQYNDRFGEGSPSYNAVRKIERFGAQFTIGVKGSY